MLVCGTLALAVPAQAQVVIDLARQRPGTTNTYAVVPGVKAVRVVNMVPIKRSYDVLVKFETIPIPALPSMQIPWIGKPGAEANLADPCDAVKSGAAALNAVDEEEAVAPIASALTTAVNSGRCTDPVPMDAARTLLARTTVDVPFDTRAGQQWTIVVSRTGGDRVWTAVVTTEPRGRWVTTYGFTFAPDRDETYFARPKDGGTFTVAAQREPRGLVAIPSVFFSWLSTKSAGRNLTFAPIAGIGVAKERPAVVGGLGITFNHNIGMVLGVSAYAQRRLHGRYAPDEEIAENLSESQLHVSEMRPAFTVSATYRFGSSPFESQDPPPAAAPAAAKAAPAPSPAAGAAKPSADATPRGAAETRASEFRLAYSQSGALAPSDAAALEMVDASLQGATDVFVISHGWWNNKESAECRYRLLIDDLRRRAPAGVVPVFIGIYWPSALFPLEKGDCESGTAPTREAMAGGTFDGQIRRWAIEAFPVAADRPAFGANLEQLIRLLSRENLGEKVSEAELTNIAAILMSWQDEGAAREADGPESSIFQLTPAAAVRSWRQNPAGKAEAFLSRGSLDFANAFTFWMMKQRAGVVGANGVFQLVKRIREKGGERLRIHLIGHSFGGKLVSGAAAGPAGAAPNIVDSVFLLQGAFSHFAFSSAGEIARLGVSTKAPGVYARLLARAPSQGLRGALVAMFSAQDTQNRFLYPLGVALANDFLEANVPRFGSVGTNGVQGPSATLVTLKSERVSSKVSAGLPRVLNVNATDVVRGHSDVVHAEVIDMIWDTVAAGMR